MLDSKTPYVVVITGPTASGKTALSYLIAQQLPVEIINADSGQLYTPLTVGTAKPQWQDHPIPHHLFDVMDQPHDFTVNQYRSAVIEKATEITQRGNIPVIVGGSLFYLKSLYYPPAEFASPSPDRVPEDVQARQVLWQELKKVDPDRAEAIHPHDIYRVKRALAIWGATKQLPSQFKPAFSPPFHSSFIWLCPPREQLYERINSRTVEMMGENPLKSPWVAETQALIDTPWEGFIRQKGFIGYADIIDWIKEGSRPEDFEGLMSTIALHTRRYAKRQHTFWRSFERILTKNRNDSGWQCTISSYEEVTSPIAMGIINDIKDRLDGLKSR